MAKTIHTNTPISKYRANMMRIFSRKLQNNRIRASPARFWESKPVTQYTHEITPSCCQDLVIPLYYWMEEATNTGTTLQSTQSSESPNHQPSPTCHCSSDLQNKTWYAPKTGEQHFIRTKRNVPNVQSSTWMTCDHNKCPVVLCYMGNVQHNTKLIYDMDRLTSSQTRAPPMFMLSEIALTDITASASHGTLIILMKRN